MVSARAARRAAALGLGALWWWAVLRLALEPGAGVLEGAVAVGGWGLSVLPVHCVPGGRRRGRGAGALAAGAVHGPGRPSGVEGDQCGRGSRRGTDRPGRAP